MEKCRYIALTDINRGPEIDDIQSILRLLLYADCIDMEGLIACSSCFVKRPKPERNLKILNRLIEAYGAALPNLRMHAEGWPSAEELKHRSAFGIPVFGKAFGNGFGEERWNENAGVQLLVSAMEKDDPRPLRIGLWGGANTLAQAIWLAKRTLDAEAFDMLLKKLRIYAISDQDYAGKWLRSTYGDRLFYIVSPSDGDVKGAQAYYKATWPGISADCFGHGSEDGEHCTNGFSGADYTCIDRAWNRIHIRKVGSYGKLYPRTKYITEGDTPSFLGIIPNGLNEPERPDYGGWGGRYMLQQPKGEPFPIWTSASDTVVGTDGKTHTSPQATIWRWRRAFQNDFAARVQWTATKDRAKTPHPPKISSSVSVLSVKPSERIEIPVLIEETDGTGFDYAWLFYPEAGTFRAVSEGDMELPTVLSVLGMKHRFAFTVPEGEGELHLLLQVTTRASLPLTRYLRIVLHVSRTGGHHDSN